MSLSIILGYPDIGDICVYICSYVLQWTVAYGSRWLWFDVYVDNGTYVWLCWDNLFEWPEYMYILWIT